MSQSVKIRNASEVVHAIHEISDILVEYQNILSEDLKTADDVESIVLETQNSVGRKRYEAQLSLVHAQNMQRESEHAKWLVCESERKIAECDRALRELHDCSRKATGLRTELRNIEKKAMENVHVHRTLQDKITLILEKMEASF